MGRVLKASDPGADGIVPVSPELLEEFPPPEFPRPYSFGDRSGDSEACECDPGQLRQRQIEEAQAEAARKIEEIRAEAYQEGYRAGEEAFRQSVASAAQCLESAAAEMRLAREDFLDSLQNEVLELAILIAERVLHREVQQDRELVLTVARRALVQLADRQQVQLWVNPLDLEALRTHKITLLEEFEGIEHIEILASEEVSSGGCIVETNRDYIDATIGNLLSKVLETLAD